jgi:hypothetical protein
MIYYLQVVCHLLVSSTHVYIKLLLNTLKHLMMLLLVIINVVFMVRLSYRPSMLIDMVLNLA